MVVFDTDVLSLLLNPAIKAPLDTATGKPVERATERIEFLISELEKSRERIVVPAPALAELLVVADEAGPDYVAELDRQATFTIEAFDGRAAIEAAATTRAAIAKGDKRSGATGHWQCIKTDRQIVAIAKTLGASRVYSNDSDMVNIGAECGIEVVHVSQLPLPPPITPLLDGLEPEIESPPPAGDPEGPSGDGTS